MHRNNLAIFSNFKIWLIWIGVKPQIAKAVLGKSKADDIAIPNFWFLTNSQVMPKHCFLDHTLNSKTVKQYFSNFNMPQNHLEGTCPGLILQVWGGAWDFVYPTSSYVTRMLLVRLTLENQCPWLLFCTSKCNKNLPQATAKIEGSQNLSPLTTTFLPSVWAGNQIICILMSCLTWGDSNISGIGPWFMKHYPRGTY